MKLPDSLNHTRFTEEQMWEAIVRDCAKVCRDNADRADKAGARTIAQTHRTDAIDIELRYSLTNTLTEHLVTERVGLLRPL
jgi:methionine synthase II (cobalamin-independent)